MSEQEMERLEEAFPMKAQEAFAEARRRALAAGLAVVEADNGAIYRVYPDGRKEFLKRIEPPIATIPGTRYLLA